MIQYSSTEERAFSGGMLPERLEEKYIIKGWIYFTNILFFLIHIV